MGWSTTTRPSPHFSGSQGASNTSPCRRTGPLQSGFRTMFNRGEFRTSSTRQCRKEPEIRKSRWTGPRKWCGGDPGPRGSRSRWFRMLSAATVDQDVPGASWPYERKYLYGAREICDFLKIEKQKNRKERMLRKSLL